MMREFHYRLRHVAGGRRPGAHPASSLGGGHLMAGHARLFDIPDPRRIDLRASLRDARREWLVRTHRQRAATPLHAVVDVSASMSFGAPASKLERVADFVESMGNSAFHAGDSAGLIGFDAAGRPVFDMPARHGRGIGHALAGCLRTLAVDRVAVGREPVGRGARGARGNPGSGLQSAIERLADREGLVFLVSDFQWHLDVLGGVLERLHRASVVPVVVWDRAEIEPPAATGLLGVTDAETGRGRALWVGTSLRARWRERVALRRHEIETLFAAHDRRPFYLLDEFDPTALSHYFLQEYG